MLSITTGRTIVGTARTQWRVALFLYMVCLPVVAAAADDAASDPHPIRPPDTSSPRDTLQSFLINAEKVAEELRRDIAEETAMQLKEVLDPYRTVLVQRRDR